MFGYYLGQWEALSQKHWTRRSNRTVWSSVLSLSHRRIHIHTDTRPKAIRLSFALSTYDWKSFTVVYFKLSAVCVCDGAAAETAGWRS